MYLAVHGRVHTYLAVYSFRLWHSGCILWTWSVAMITWRSMMAITSTPDNWQSSVIQAILNTIWHPVGMPSSRCQLMVVLMVQDSTSTGMEVSCHPSRHKQKGSYLGLWICLWQDMPNKSTLSTYHCLSPIRLHLSKMNILLSTSFNIFQHLPQCSISLSACHSIMPMGFPVSIV